MGIKQIADRNRSVSADNMKFIPRFVIPVIISPDGNTIINDPIIKATSIVSIKCDATNINQVFKNTPASNIISSAGQCIITHAKIIGVAGPILAIAEII